MTINDMQDKLKILYKEIADMTLPMCKQCKPALSCCSREYCEMAIETAKSEYGVDLQTTDHSTLPLMSESGCVSPPHYRKLCSLHTCSVNSLGFEKNANQEWNDKYFDLRGEIGLLEIKVFKINTKRKKQNG